MKKEIEPQYFCDVCGKQIGDEELSLVDQTVLTRFVTEQEEGRKCKPYWFPVSLDLCEGCALKAFGIDGSGAQGYNRYSIRSES